MEDKESIDVDSLAWGSASKDVLRKVYGNLDKTPNVMAMKIEIANTLAEFALKQITSEEMKNRVIMIKEHYETKHSEVG